MNRLAEARILVTGGTGRIGVETVGHLAGLGARITVLSDRDSPRLGADRFLVGDTMSEHDVARALDGVDFVVHLAALGHRDAGSPYAVYTTNVVSTFNVLAQAGAAGIGRAVVAGSINRYGLPMGVRDIDPAYFPLDTDIPVDISDWYSLSKLNDENTCRMAWAHWGIDVVTLRFPHVNTSPGLAEFAARATADPRSSLREAWSYLDVRDAARAIELALTADTSGARAFFLAAGQTCVPYRTEAMIEAFAPGIPRLRRFVGREVPIDLTPARALIGFEARHELELAELELPEGI